MGIPLSINLKRDLVGASLRWPTKKLKRICTPGGFQSVSHPKSNSKNKGILEPAVIGHWADRFHSCMNV
ncbi:MAG: hypothetical protein KZQ96_13370 [Candidatus Thiodiazotropha sp. (ex Lucinoma borealis)]|nr:hypothetical protein [Candidatus Thiodiazotropha sp. (ex Lucinoma borealis)]